MNPDTARRCPPTGERPSARREFWDGTDHAFNPTGPVRCRRT